MITDVWDGLGVYTSDDFTHWTRQEGNLLKEAGTRPMDTQIGNHADVVVKDNHAYILFILTIQRSSAAHRDIHLQKRRSALSFRWQSLA